jgi:hypothetical protein
MQYSNRFLLFAFAFSSRHHGLAQSYKIGTIDIYGNRKISSSNVLAHLRVKEEDSITHENFKAADEAAKLEQQMVRQSSRNYLTKEMYGRMTVYIFLPGTVSGMTRINLGLVLRKEKLTLTFGIH